MFFNIVLFQPEKPLNTGNIGRTCFLTNSKLHLIKPFKFSLDEKEVRRAGLDYWKNVDLEIHENFYDFYDKYNKKDNNIYICSTKAKNIYTNCSLKYGDSFLFGKESSGLPQEIMDLISDDHKIRVPMMNFVNRSLNVANTVSVILYEALRQVGFLNMK